MLSDDEVRDLARLKLSLSQNDRLGELQAKGKTADLAEVERYELLALLQVYQLGQLRKSEAILANIGLHGLETYLKSTNPKLGVVRYADDFIVTARDKGSLELAQVQIQHWLSSRGLELSSEKTFITPMEDGYDFLGFNHRHYNGKLLIKPTKKKVLDFCKRIGVEIKAMNGAKQEDVIAKLNPILRGFANYYKGVVSKETFSYISYRVWQYLWRWAKRRHPNKNTTWVRKAYFKTINGNKWRFACNISEHRGMVDRIYSLYPRSDLESF